MDDLTRYVQRGHRDVEGWLRRETARFIAILGKLQEEKNIRGASLEIGVHHGGLFILLPLAGARQRDLAIDVFSDQHLNPDRSGHGDREIFLANLRRHGGDLGRVEILQKSSLDVSAAEILKLVGPATLFSVDGGHSQECAFNDLMLADGVIAPDGVVILDDFFNFAWPEVVVGAMKYFDTKDTRLKPFAASKEKLYLCAPDKNEFYRTSMRKRLEPWEYGKTVTMFGLPVDVYWVNGKPRTGLRRLLARSSVASVAHGLMRTVIRR